MTSTVVADNPEQERYEIRVDGELAGFAEYRGTEPRALTHTEILEAYGGRGLGTELIAATLADLRERGLHVVPLCPFVKAYLDGHHADLDLVAPHIRTAYGLPEPDG